MRIANELSGEEDNVRFAVGEVRLGENWVRDEAYGPDDNVWMFLLDCLGIWNL